MADEGKFLAKPLGALSAIYRFVGGVRAVSKLEVISPIQVVHDVSREAELGASLYFVISHSMTTAGGGAPFFVTLNMADLFSGVLSGISGQLNALGRTRENTDVWLMSSSGHTAGVNFFGGAVSFLPPNNQRMVSFMPITTARFLWQGNSTFAPGVTVAAGLRPLSAFLAVGDTRAGWMSDVKLPAMVETIQVAAEDDGVGATTILYNHTVAFVPVGSIPPPSV